MMYKMLIINGLPTPRRFLLCQLSNKIDQEHNRSIALFYNGEPLLAKKNRILFRCPLILIAKL